jgi:hypothetical protein
VLELLSQSKARALFLDTPSMLAGLSLSLEYASAQLTELYIHDVALTVSQLQAISDTSRSPGMAQLTLLSLQNDGIDDSSLQYVLHFVARTPSLQALLLDDNHIGEQSWCRSQVIVS